MTISEAFYEAHKEESMKLDAMGYVRLFLVRLKNPDDGTITELYLCPQKQVVWQGKTWANWAAHLTGYKQDSQGQTSRPSFSIANPEGIWSRYAHAGWTNNAEIIRYHVLSDHIAQNINSYVRHTWRIDIPLSLNRNVAVFQCRSALDGQFFILPAEQYLPPKYPGLSL